MFVGLLRGASSAREDHLGRYRAGARSFLRLVDVEEMPCLTAARTFAASSFVRLAASAALGCETRHAIDGPAIHISSKGPATIKPWGHAAAKRTVADTATAAQGHMIL